MRKSHWKTVALVAVLWLCLGLFLPGTSLWAQTSSSDVANYITEDGLVPGQAVCAAIDPGGWTWIGARVTDGVDVAGFSIIGAGRRIMSFSKEDGLVGDSVNDIIFDEENNRIWFATSRGVSRLDSKTGQWKNFNNTNSNLRENEVSSLLLDNGKLMAATLGEGIFLFSPGEDNFFEVKSPFSDVTDILVDSRGRLWASSRQGVAYREKDVWVTYTTDNSSLQTNHVDGLTEDVQGNILGSSQKGIVVFNGISWSIMDTSNSPLPVDHVTFVQGTPNDDLWIATWGGGLVHLDKSRNLVKTYSRRNSHMLDNKISAFARDRNGNFYLCTARGVTFLVVNPVPEKSERIRVISRQAYQWTDDGEPQVDSTVSMGIGRHHYGFPIWGWIAFWAGDGFDPVNPGVNLQGDVQGNRQIRFTGKFSQVKLLQQFLTEGDVVRNFRETPGATYPFPSKMPPEVAAYLKPGQHIPSEDPKIQELAQSLVRTESRVDMMRTAEDIIYSVLFTAMPYDYSKVGRHEGLSTRDPRESLYRSAQEVLRDRTGTAYSKNRLACTLLRSAGIPARLVSGDDANIWGEAYIGERGWVPFNTEMPYYTIGEGHRNRIQFPFNIQEPNFPVVWVSGTDDNIKAISWEPADEATFHRGEKQFEKLTQTENITDAKILLIDPSQFETIPNESRIPVSETLWMTLRMEGSHYTLKFYDKSNGRILGRTPITQYHKTMTAEVEGRLRMTFIPSDLDRYIVLRMFEWEVFDR